MKKFMNNYLGVMVFYLILIIGALLISTRYKNIIHNYDETNQYNTVLASK